MRSGGRNVSNNEISKRIKLLFSKKGFFCEKLSLPSRGMDFDKNFYTPICKLLTSQDPYQELLDFLEKKRIVFRFVPYREKKNLHYKKITLERNLQTAYILDVLAPVIFLAAFYPQLKLEFDDRDKHLPIISAQLKNLSRTGGLKKALLNMNCQSLQEVTEDLQKISAEREVLLKNKRKRAGVEKEPDEPLEQTHKKIPQKQKEIENALKAFFSDAKLLKPYKNNFLHTPEELAQQLFEAGIPKPYSTAARKLKLRCEQKFLNFNKNDNQVIIINNILPILYMACVHPTLTAGEEFDKTLAETQTGFAQLNVKSKKPDPNNFRKDSTKPKKKRNKSIQTSNTPSPEPVVSNTKPDPILSVEVKQSDPHTGEEQKNEPALLQDVTSNNGNPDNAELETVELPKRSWLKRYQRAVLESSVVTAGVPLVALAAAHAVTGPFALAFWAIGGTLLGVLACEMIYTRCYKSHNKKQVASRLVGGSPERLLISSHQTKPVYTNESEIEPDMVSTAKNHSPVPLPEGKRKLSITKAG